MRGKISLARNRILADIFLRLEIIEKVATGVRRIKEYYKDSKSKPQFLISDNSILVILPKVQFSDEAVVLDMTGRMDHLPERVRQIYELISEREPITRSEIEKTIGIGKSQTIELINQLRFMNLVAQIGRGPSTAYVTTDLKS